jgi:tripartite-type tricarboxylate transporter receptor subunit TctC
MMNDLLSGQIKIGFDEVLTSMQQIKAGKLIPVATTGSTRWPALPTCRPSPRWAARSPTTR